MDKMLEKQIQMVDLRRQYERLRSEINPAMQTVIDACAFINGPQVKGFCNHLSDYLGIPYAIPCGNGTDALQISLMALDLHPGDEVIVEVEGVGRLVNHIISQQAYEETLS